MPPRLVVERLLGLLVNVEAELYSLWIDSKNYDMAARIEKQRDILEKITISLYTLIEPATPSVSSDVS
jgi:hypothetical protein